MQPDELLVASRGTATKTATLTTLRCTFHETYLARCVTSTWLGYGLLSTSGSTSAVPPMMQPRSCPCRAASSAASRIATASIRSGLLGCACAPLPSCAGSPRSVPSYPTSKVSPGLPV